MLTKSIIFILVLLMVIAAGCGGGAVVQLCYYLDSDGDGYGNPDKSSTAISQPIGYVSNKTDCDDDNPMINPGATDICGNDIDEDCAGGDKDCTPVLWYQDSDSDNYGDPDNSKLEIYQPEGYVADNTDCDDGDGTIYPGAAELCDGQLNNCGGSLPSTESDNDSDGYVECSIDAGGWDGAAITGGDDCNDSDQDINPGATEVPDNAIDEDCDGCVLRTYFIDSDGDGFGVTDSTELACSLPGGYSSNSDDCDDSDQDINPGATEVPDNAIDEDCNGLVAYRWYYDSDEDGYGDPGNTTDTDNDDLPPPGYIADDTDCDDSDPLINPGATEDYSNNIDENCDGCLVTDDALDVLTYYLSNIYYSTGKAALADGYIVNGMDQWVDGDQVGDCHVVSKPVPMVMGFNNYTDYFGYSDFSGFTMDGESYGYFGTYNGPYSLVMWGVSPSVINVTFNGVPYTVYDHSVKWANAEKAYLSECPKSYFLIDVAASEVIGDDGKPIKNPVNPGANGGLVYWSKDLEERVESFYGADILNTSSGCYFYRDSFKTAPPPN
ncbi:MAG: hypothetical protein HQ553_17360 [Chloroflexi bacterium]|nr:hypothetical protein [Chloroflexota bacterium]